MKRIVYLPLDERPCNAAFAAQMCEGNPDFMLIRPPRRMLGKKKQPADHRELARFLLETCAAADALICSVDMLLYGGIVPSRLHCLSSEELVRRLSLLEDIKRENPKLKIYAFALLMRCPSYSSADEEPDYYENCGREIFLTGQAEHRYRVGELDRENYEKAIAEYRKKTDEHLSDYLARRRKNLDMVLRTVRLQKNVIDVLVLPQDDSAPYGYTAMDRAGLFLQIQREGLVQPPVYPGADEAGMTLLARAVNEMRGARPKIAVRYAAERGKTLIPLYEDRPLSESVRSQILAAGCEPCGAEEADMVLFVNVPSEGMADIGSAGGKGYFDRDLAVFVQEMKEEADAGRIVLAADVAYCNGGDADWAKRISRTMGFLRLGGYAGWNTSSNTLGTVIAEGVMYFHYGDTPAHGRFLAERAYEDIGYCGHVRKYICETVCLPMGLDWFHTDGPNGRVAAAVRAELERYIGELLPEVAAKYAVDRCEMPWNRMFETALTVKEK